ncbi:hypothetical protein D3C87_2017470 [compost metagenome]
MGLENGCGEIGEPFGDIERPLMPFELFVIELAGVFDCEGKRDQARLPDILGK